MGHRATSITAIEQSLARRYGISRPFRVLALALAGTLVISALLVIPGWIPVLPRPIRRGLTEAFLQTVLAVYYVLVLVALFGTVIFGWLLARSFGIKKVRPGIARLFLASLSCLLALILLELGAAGRRAWMHRFPTLSTRFAASPPEDYRIVVLGESSASGEPFWPWLSVGQIVAWQLSEAVADRRFDCEMLAFPGDSLEMQHQKLADLQRRPDAVIIYAGHNEFAARYEEEREGWLDEQAGTGLARLAYRATLSSSFCSLAYEIISKNRLDRPPPLALRHELIDPPLCSHVESAEIRDDFSRRLEALVSYCDQIGALPILIIPPGNEAGYEPGRSTIPPSVPVDERRRLVDEFIAARALESHDARASAVKYELILERHPGFAEAHFRLARLLERQGRVEEAGLHYLAALDNDGLPLRCQAPFRAAFEQVAKRHPRSILIDGRRELIAVSPNGLIGDHVIHDTHHPTLRGYIALARAVLRELDRGAVFRDAKAFQLPIDPAACAAHFGMNAEKWVDVCNRISEHYKRVAGYRYDPTERLEKSRLYAEAARRISRGKPIDDLGLPGLPDAATRQPDQEFQVPDSRVQRGISLHSSMVGLFAYLFDLPVLQVDHRAAAQEVNHRHELIPLRPANHLTDHAGQWAGCDSNGCPDRHRVFRGDRQARAQHGVNLLEVACQCLLIDDLDHAHQPVTAQREHPVVDISLHEHIAGEERDNRLDSPSLGRASFFQYLGEVIDGPLGPEVTGRRLFLSRLSMQAPPDRLPIGPVDRGIIP
jgi:hypothetical protein